MPDINLAPVQAVTPVRAPESATGKPQNNADSERLESSRSFADTLRNQRQTEARRSAATTPARERSANPEKPQNASPAAPEQAADKTGAPEAQQADSKPAGDSANTKVSEKEKPAEDAMQTAAAPADAAAQALLLAAALKPAAPQQATAPAIDAGAASETDGDSAVDPLTADPLNLAAAANPAQTAAKAAAPTATVAAQDATLDNSPQTPAANAGTAGAASAAPELVVSKSDQPASNAPAKAEPTVTGPNFAAELERAASAAAEPGIKETSNVALQQTYASLDTKAASGPELPTRQVIATPLGHRAWADEVGQKLTWVATQDNGMAELILTPPQLGRVEVSINLNGDQATAQFVAASQAARDALNDALPRLREMLAQAGIQLGQADVSAQHSNQSGEEQGQRRAGGLAGGLGNEVSGDLAGGSSTGWVRQGRGLVDTFA